MFGSLVNFGGAGAGDDWKSGLVPSSFRGVEFKVEAAGRAGGRRGANFEFPKKDTPYVEDMGRRGRRFAVTAYLIGDDYQTQRDELIRALEQEGPGLLNHYTLGQHRVTVDTFNVGERRDRGRFCEIEMQFFEAGRPPSQDVKADTQAGVRSSAEKASDAAAAGADRSAKMGAAAGTWEGGSGAAAP